jgi:UDP-3-O-[3-hydroxymyristoyl] glucosamine N-acyltransferase
MAFDLTLLGFSALSYPVLVELAAAAWRRDAASLRVQVVHNLPMPEALDLPDGWEEPTAIPLANWSLNADNGVIMPGVMHEPAVSTVVHLVSATTGMEMTQLGTIIHPTAVIAPSASIGAGTWIHSQTTVASMSRLGPCCHINRNASVGHHNTWGAFSRLNPGAHTGGLCEVGERVTIGIGAAVRQEIHIGDGATVGGGSMVIRNVENGQLVVGNPAKPLAPKKSHAN